MKVYRYEIENFEKMRVFEVKGISYLKFYNKFSIDLYGKDLICLNDIFGFKMGEHIYTFKELNDREIRILRNPKLKELETARCFINCKKYISGFKI